MSKGGAAAWRGAGLGAVGARVHGMRKRRRGGSTSGLRWGQRACALHGWVGGWGAVGGLQAGFGIRGLALCSSLGGCRVALASWHRCKGLESKGVVAPWPRGKPPKTLSGSPRVFP